MLSRELGTLGNHEAYAFEVVMVLENIFATLFVFPFQLSYHRQRHKEVITLTTVNATAELTLPEDDEEYIIFVQTLSEGGLGPASDPIRIHQLSKLGVHVL